MLKSVRTSAYCFKTTDLSLAGYYRQGWNLEKVVKLVFILDPKMSTIIITGNMSSMLIFSWDA